jgi:putative transposase
MGVMTEELGMDKDHVHRFVSFPPKYSIGQVLGVFKVVSVKEIRAEFPAVRKQLWMGSFGMMAIVCARWGIR